MSSRIKEYPGKEVTPSDFKEGRLCVACDRRRLDYAWSTGVAVGRFLKELKNARLVARRCRGCERVLIPPRVFCEECFRPTDEWVYLPDTGRVNTYSFSYVRADASRVKDPVIVAVITIDETSGKAGLLHLLKEVEPKNVQIGMRVEAVWKPRGRRRGAITDIRYFRPITR